MITKVTVDQSLHTLGEALIIATLTSEKPRGKAQLQEDRAQKEKERQENVMRHLAGSCSVTRIMHRPSMCAGPPHGGQVQEVGEPTHVLILPRQTYNDQGRLAYHHLAQG